MASEIHQHGDHCAEIEKSGNIRERHNENIREKDEKIREKDEEIREKMRRYWDVYKPSLESMMLSHDAKYLAENEQNEILSYLPPYQGKKVLELGAGIGRFTTRLAQLSEHLTAVDFMESYIKENEETNKQFGNVTFLCADVTKLEFPDESFDIVFSNWLLMYLSDAEVEKLMNTILKWLKPNGFFFFRESCYHPSGNVARVENPTKYRTPIDYVRLLGTSSTGKMRYEMKFAKSVLTYIRAHGNPNQLVILAKQVEERKSDPGKCNTDILEFIKSNLNIHKDKVNDEAALSSIAGGKHTIKSLAAKLPLKSGHKIISIGCGTGEVPSYLVGNYGVFVYGIDENITNIHCAIEVQGKLALDVRKKIQFEFTNIAEANLPTETFELALCLSLRYQHFASMQLIRKVKKWIQPGGHFVFTTLVKTDLEELVTKDYFSQHEIESELQSLGFAIKELSSDWTAAVRWFKSLSSTQKLEIDDVAQKIDLLQQQKLDWIKVIALKCETD